MNLGRGYEDRTYAKTVLYEIALQTNYGEKMIISHDILHFLCVMKI